MDEDMNMTTSGAMVVSSSIILTITSKSLVSSFANFVIMAGLSFLPILSLFMFVFGMGMLIYGIVHSRTITLAGLVIASIIGLVIWGEYFGVGVLFTL